MVWEGLTVVLIRKTAADVRFPVRGQASDWYLAWVFSVLSSKGNDSRHKGIEWDLHACILQGILGKKEMVC